jgi:hypothetical protein
MKYIKKLQDIALQLEAYDELDGSDLEYIFEQMDELNNEHARHMTEEEFRLLDDCYMQKGVAEDYLQGIANEELQDEMRDQRSYLSLEGNH